MRDPSRATGPFGLALLNGLQGKHMYAGTVPAARRARRVNRRGGAR